MIEAKAHPDQVHTKENVISNTQPDVETTQKHKSIGFLT